MTNKMTATIFCSFLLVIFLFASIVSWPGEKTINIREEGKEAFSELSDQWFFLEADSYEVTVEFEEFITHHSTFYYPITYCYFNVLVTDERGRQFIMAVRTGKKTETLRKGKTVDLYGMISPLDEERAEAQINSLYKAENGKKIYAISLNDNDSSMMKQYMKSAFFILGVILDFLFICKIIGVRK